jgi:uncharacterized protein DUF5615
MKILLDECVVQELRRHLVGHAVFTVGYVGWSGVQNGQLLDLAASEGFEAIITTDRNIPYQQNPSLLPLAIVVLLAESNDIEDLAKLVPELLRELSDLRRNAVTYVGPFRGP